MKLQAYRYTSPEATFLVFPDNGRWGLSINDRFVADYETPEDAAYDVSAQNTGDTSWDALEDVDVPEQLQDWVLIPYNPAMAE